jgi:hypothetical protein
MPSPAMIVALIALACSLAGGAYAVVKLRPNSVRSKQIARNAVKSPDIAPNAAKGIDVNEATLGKVPDADKLDGLDSTALVRSFGAHINDTAPDLIFTVPEMEVSIVGDLGAASSNGFRIKNDSNDTVRMSDLEFAQEADLSVPANTTSADQLGGSTGPFVVTAESHPDLLLLFGCVDHGVQYCFGQLMRAPAGG